MPDVAYYRNNWFFIDLFLRFITNKLYFNALRKYVNITNSRTAINKPNIKSANLKKRQEYIETKRILIFNVLDCNDDFFAAAVAAGQQNDYYVVFM